MKIIIPVLALMASLTAWGQDSSNVRRVWQQPLPALAVVLDNGFAYVAARDSGLYIFDVSNLAAPVQVGVFDTLGYIEGVAVRGL